MKRVKNLIKLTNLNSEKLSEKELNHVIGGHCTCGCFYENCGGSTQWNNMEANEARDLHSEYPPVGAELYYQD